MTHSIVVLISGSGSNLQAIIDACEAGRFKGKIRAVISNSPSAYGLERAQNHQIPTHILEHSAYPDRTQFDNALMTTIDHYQPNLVVLAGFMRILSPHFVRHYQGHLLNIHPSLLPAYPGLRSVERALEAGENEHGTTVHFVTDEVDGGPIILQAKVPVFENDTLEELYARVQYQEHQIYPLVVKWFCEDRLMMQDGQAYLDQEPLTTSGYAS